MIATCSLNTYMNERTDVTRFCNAATKDARRLSPSQIIFLTFCLFFLTSVLGRICGTIRAAVAADSALHSVLYMLCGCARDVG